MGWTRKQIGLAILLVITGSINTLSTKWADMLEAVNSAGEKKPFNHPFLQALAMFLGEILCLVTFKIVFFSLIRKPLVSIPEGGTDRPENVNELTKGTREFSPFLLMIPAMCDMVSTSVMYVGLNMTYASSFQMFRGSVIIFVAILSIAFLHRRLCVREWIGMVIVIIGLVVVGVSDFVYGGGDDKNYTTNGIITGDLLIIVAQVITAVQMVVEEKFVAGKDIPALQAVGWEGIFGFVVLGLLQFAFYFIKFPGFNANPRGVLEDVPDGFVQMGNNPLLVLSLVGTILSIAFFNYAGISVTKEISATTRMVLDSVRTLIIWIFSLAFFDQKFQYLQLIGFIVLLVGMCLYNNITFKEQFLACRDRIRRSSENYGQMSNDVKNNDAAEVTETSENSVP